VDLSRATSGAFDITVAPLVALWDLRGAGREAGDAEVRETLDRVGWERLRLDAHGRMASLARPGMKLDPGSIGKGYALDAAGRVLRARGVRRALMDFGGQIMAMGSPEGQPGWEVAIADPRRRDEPALAVWLRDASLSISGNDQKGIMVNGRLLGHLLDPRTGRPVMTRGSVSVISPDATTADALSTALLVMGSDQGLRWMERRPDLQAVFLDVDERGGIRALSTPGFSSINVTSGHSAATSHSSREDTR
jgi:thiamine biosynthesis lipoprotein